jgi:hypothetical protein
MSGTWDNPRLFTAGGIPYKLLQGYPTLDVADDGKASAEESYLIRATDLETFLNEVSPTPSTDADNTRRIPGTLRLTGTTTLVLKSLHFEPHSGEKPGDPFGADPNAPAETYDDTYRVDLKYETAPDSGEEGGDPEDPQTFLDESLAVVTEMLSIEPNGDTTAAGAALDRPHVPLIKIIPIAEVTLSWKKVVRPHFSNIFDGLGTVNSNAYDWLFNAPPGTALFLGISGKREFVFKGARTAVKPWSLDFKFASRRIKEEGVTYGWNHIYNPKTHKWEELKRRHPDGTLHPLYESSGFTLLFQTASP